MKTRYATRIIFYVIAFFLAVAVYPDNGPNHRIRQNRPVRLGTSGSNIRDITTDFCCGGTLGALVQNRFGVRYILSNNHVLVKSNAGKAGDPISQPGLIDLNCSVQRANPVAMLSRFARISFTNPNRVDAAIARVLQGQVTRVGRILDIGLPGQPAEPSIGQGVKKSGRSTGKTTGKITAIHVTVLVDMPNDCGSTTTKRARFIDQFIIEPTPNLKKFLDDGDSGSLVVANRKTCAPSIGLLFAGDDSGTGVANRIISVLSRFHVSIVGCPLIASPASAAMTQMDSRVIAAEAVQQKSEERLFRIPGVVAVGVSGQVKNDSSPLSITVFVQRGSMAATSATAIPARLDTLPVRVIHTSGFRAM